MRMNADKRDLFLYEAFLYFNPLLIVVSFFMSCNSAVWKAIWVRITCYLIQNLFNWMLQTLMVWLWGVNLWVFSQSSVNYAKVFDLDHTHLTHREIWKVYNIDFTSQCATIVLNSCLHTIKLLLVSSLLIYIYKITITC